MSRAPSTAAESTCRRVPARHYKGIEHELEAAHALGLGGTGVRAGGRGAQRLNAVRSLLERQRVASSQIGTLDAIAVALRGADANAQCSRSADGVLSDRQSFYLANEAERPQAEVIEEFLLQYYETAAAVPAQIVVETPVSAAAIAALAQRRRVLSRSAPQSGAKNAGSSSSPRAMPRSPWRRTS